jgi:uncharacterized membrane protein SpoIIM required for sporulation
MTFFNWSDAQGKTRVSSYIWIYVLVTVLFTVSTLGLWYFFVVYRKATRPEIDVEKTRVE